METIFEDHGWKITMESASLPDGRTKKTARIHRTDSGHVIAFSKPGTILLLREFRPFYGEYLWMIPSGRIDKESDIAEGARRELREETGYDADEFEFLCTANHSESWVSANHVFVARKLKKSPLPQDADEMIEVHEVPIEEALDRILASPKVHLPSAYALFYYLRKQA